MSKSHLYHLNMRWTGNKGDGTKNYRSYERSYTIAIPNKVDLEGSADPAFRGDPTKYNPEELLLASLSSCHMLWYLHFCAEASIVVLDYTDQAVATMIEDPNGSGYFKEVSLQPIVKVAHESMIQTALELHKKANKYCFIANSVNFTVYHKPTCSTLPTSS